MKKRKYLIDYRQKKIQIGNTITSYTKPDITQYYAL